MGKDEQWGKYNRKGATMPPRLRLVDALDYYCPDSTGVALDLGCGGGRDSMELLKRGWQLVAIDNQQAALNLLDENAKTFVNQFELSLQNFEELNLKEKHFDLINASYSLPFCNPLAFPEMWQMIYKNLKKGGLLTCELFGDNDDWAKKSSDKMSFFNRNEVDFMLNGFDVKVLTEEEIDKPSFSEPMKHWHVYTVIASKL